MCNTLAELLTTVKKLESKVDTLLANSRKQSSSIGPGNDDEYMDLISSMPVGIDDFNELNERIAKNASFKQYLVCIIYLFLSIKFWKVIGCIVPN